MSLLFALSCELTLLSVCRRREEQPHSCREVGCSVKPAGWGTYQVATAHRRCWEGKRCRGTDTVNRGCFPVGSKRKSPAGKSSL